MLLPQDSDLGTFIGRFFSSLQDIASRPDDLSARTVAIENGKALANSFNSYDRDIQSLCSCLDKHNINDANFDEYYFSKRIIENVTYLTFTNILNHLYENQKPISKSIIKASHYILSQFPYLKNLFIKQAMGKIS